MKRLTTILLVILSSCSISYKFNGASINYETTKTISVANFPIKAALVYPPLEELFTNSLKNAYTRQTRLQMVSSGGDLQLEGEITNYDLTPQAVTENAYASQTRLTISVRVRFTNTKDPQYDIDQTFSGYKDFSSDRMLTDVQDELIQQITDELVITREQIRNLLNGIGDETISKSDADQMAADYPYFNIPQLLYLKFTPGAMPDEKRIQQALIYASPHAHLETILGVEGESFADLYPKAPRTDSTMQAIDLFLGTYRKEQKRGNEEESLDRIISGNILAQSDYISNLQKEEQADLAATPVHEHETNPSPAVLPETTGRDQENTEQSASSESSNDDTFFTESLAKIYIKQRRYEKALQIIKKLSLKYPEKNIYFADQIRFLEKLIINIKTE